MLVVVPFKTIHQSGVMSVEPLPEQEEAVVGVVNINLPWQDKT